jgi:hypothetical protein
MRELSDLVTRARAGSLRSSEMTDPTITVTNLGDQGVESVAGVIYPPQVAIVGLGRIAERPWAQDGWIRAVPLLTATLAADHRVTDGIVGARFLAELPAFYRELMCHWQAHLDAADSFMSAPGSGTTEQQLARLLLALEEGKCPSLPRGDIGAALGVTMETASRLMASFRRRGLIRGTGRHLQCNAAPLRQLIAGATKG